MRKFVELKKFLYSPYREYFLTPVLILGLAFFELFKGSRYENGFIIFLWSVAIIGALPVISRAWKPLSEKRISIEVFNLFALFIALALGRPAAGLWIELMLSFAAYLDWRTRTRASNAIEELLRLKPEIAHKESQNGEIVDIHPSNVSIGDIVVVKTGERVPVDGEIVFGDGVFDESSFTGESLPQEKSEGAKVYTATILSSGVVKVRADKVGEDTVLSQMVLLMRQAAEQKSKMHRFADRFASFFLPAVAIFGSGILFFTNDFSVLASFFLVICADDIAIAIPLAIEASLGSAAKRGVIIKGGAHLETLAKATTVVFDKTGTLTQGKFSVDTVEIESSVPMKQFWKYVAIAEKFSEHPIGKAVYAKAISIVGEVEDPLRVDVLTGSGVFAHTLGADVVIGNERAFSSHKITLSSEARACISGKHDHAGKTILLVAVNGVYTGSILVADTPRDDAIPALETLRAMGIHTIMLTGDRSEVANDIAKQLGISEVIAGLTPETKLIKIAELAQKTTVVMVGDGVNDAPALARASVGIAMGGIGTAVAVEAADIIIQTDRLERIPEVLSLARRTRRIIIQNVWIWFFTNAFGTWLVLTRVASIPLAAFYNFASDFIPLINSTRLFKKDK